MDKFGLWAARLLTALWVFAFAIFVVGTYGLLGQEKDPLSGVYLLPLGVPWVYLFDYFEDSIRPWATAFAPLLNITLLYWLCRRKRA